jgi:hypothetical protein
MRRLSVILGMLGLVWAVALPAASAAVLWQPDLSKGKLEGVNGLFIQGIGGTALADPTAAGIGVAPFVIDNNTSADDKRKLGWLDGGDSVGIAEDPGDDTSTDPTVRTAPFMLLTGDPKWADVAIQSRMDSWDQNTGAAALILRAAPKTKDTDPDSRYELRYMSDNTTLLASEKRDGIPANDKDTSKDADGDTARPISLRIMKVVKGKWTMLAEVNAASSSVHIPLINRLGVDHDVNKAGDDDGNQPEDTLTGGYFRFVAKGDLLQGLVSLDGKKFDVVIEAHDSELKSGLVGFMHYDWRPLFKDILVEDAP